MIEPGKRKVLFVLSGGGMPGLDIHAGIWAALEASGIFATDLSGTSAGAIVGAANAIGWKAAGFGEYLRQHDDSDVRHGRSLWQVRAPWLESIHDNDRIRIILETVMPPQWIKVTKPFSAWACRKRTGSRVNVARPELAETPADAVLASMAISGIFPSVRLLDGEDYVDGGMRFNLPLLSNWRDYDEVWLLIGKTRPQDYEGTGIVSNLIRNLDILQLDQIQDVLDETGSILGGACGNAGPRVRVIWPELPCKTSMLRFNHDLIDAAYVYTLRQLNKERRG
jgi:predicted acylesterase/phospholipase RssA